MNVRASASAVAALLAVGYGCAGAVGPAGAPREQVAVVDVPEADGAVSGETRSRKQGEPAETEPSDRERAELKRTRDRALAVDAGVLGALSTDASVLGVLSAGDASMLGALIDPDAAGLGTVSGYGGLGLRGVGRGGGGRASGLGGLGGLGHGSGTGYASSRRRPPRVSLSRGPVAVAAGDAERKIIYRIVSVRKSQLRFCYSRELRKDPKLAATVSVAFVIAKDGRVSSARVSLSTGKPALDRCVLGVFRRMRFPALTDPLSVRFPVVFSLPPSAVDAGASDATGDGSGP